MSQIELDRKAEIEAIELTEVENNAAIQEGKVKKWFHLHNDEYWNNQKGNATPIKAEVIGTKNE